ncbi:AI-2E family transporter [Psychrobacter sp. I-STPA10]|uniref:AI-2E family transporter n=1 Tax=Psychrobacter sp. I-STPA10 TaxID=2585769 RepID=UPI001E4BF5AA|nr:AI-2E family transporter [Psychrobacter sp. I-STPA10]
MQSLKAQKSFIFMVVMVITFMLSLWLLTRVWLLIFASILMAVFILSLVSGLRNLPVVGKWLQHIPHGVMVALVLLLIFAVFTGFVTLFGQELLAQLEEMKTALPAAVERVEEYVAQTPYMNQISDWLEQNERFNPLQDAISKAMAFMPSLLSGVMGGLSNFMIIMLLGIFLAISPSIYVNSFIALIPPAKRDKGRYLFNQTYKALRQWLLGQFVVMLFVGVCTSVALWWMDIPFALAMGFISFLLDFIPVLGPWIAAIPIILIAILFTPDMVLWVIVMMIIVQQLESYVIAPLIQQKLVNLPPVALLISQVVMGSLTGFLGIALATPLAVTFIVWVQVLYIKFTLGDYKVRILGQNIQDMLEDEYAKPSKVDKESVYQDDDSTQQSNDNTATQ